MDPGVQSLQLREDIKRGIYVDGLIEETVTNAFETYELLRIGAQNRHVGSTSMNKESSRSHSVFTLLIESKHNHDGLMNFRSSRFHLIDLAGSERQKATDAAGERLKEAGMINKSLSALGNVINSLVDISEGRSRHVHYRDSKLTFLLKDSLGGNSKTFIVANISPANSAYSETLSTLKFAQRAKQIKNMAIINEDTTGTVYLLKEEIRRLKDALASNKVVEIKECPKCNGKMIDPIEVNDAKFELENLLEKKMRLNENTEGYLKIQISEKDRLIQSMSSAITKFEKKINNDKMVIKFRDATIARLTGQNPPDADPEVINLKKEIDILKDQIESNPIAAKYFVENERIKIENNELRRELKMDPTSAIARLEELENFSKQLSLSLKNSAEDREAIKHIIQESTQKDSQIVLETEIIEYEEKLSDLNKQLDEQAKNYSEFIENIENEKSGLIDEIERLLNKKDEELEIQKEADNKEMISNMNCDLEKITLEIELENEKLRKIVKLQSIEKNELERIMNEK